MRYTHLIACGLLLIGLSVASCHKSSNSAAPVTPVTPTPTVVRVDSVSGTFNDTFDWYPGYHFVRNMNTGYAITYPTDSTVQVVGVAYNINFNYPDTNIQVTSTNISATMKKSDTMFCYLINQHHYSETLTIRNDSLFLSSFRTQGGSDIQESTSFSARIVQK